MNKLRLLTLMLCIFTISGCGTINGPTSQVSPATIKSETQLIEYKSKLISVEYPKDYKANENGDMLIISGTKGKIIIGGFIPSNGYPESDKKDFPFRQMTYTRDPMTESGAIPAALFYSYGDTKTENELSDILKTVKNLP